MNRVNLIGRLTKDPEVRTTPAGLTVATYTLAVDRPVKKEGEERNADFIRCTSFGKTAEFCERYLFKGTKIGVDGRIQTGSYTDKDGKTVYTTDVIVESHTFCESRGNRQQAEATQTESSGEFVSVPDSVDDEGLPFR